jgi:hypothetical protein
MALRTAEEVKAQLDALQAQWGIDEFIIDTPIAEGRARLASLGLLAQAHLGAGGTPWIFRHRAGG